MAQISLASILSILDIPGGLAKRNDIQFWSGWLSDGASGKVTVTSVEVEETGLAVEMNLPDGTQLKVAALPHDLHGTEVLINDVPAPHTSLIFQPKPSIGNLSRFAFDFRPIAGTGHAYRLNLRFDP